MDSRLEKTKKTAIERKLTLIDKVNYIEFLQGKTNEELADIRLEKLRQKNSSKLNSFQNNHSGHFRNSYMYENLHDKLVAEVSVITTWLLEGGYDIHKYSK